MARNKIFIFSNGRFFPIEEIQKYAGQLFRGKNAPAERVLAYAGTDSAELLVLILACMRQRLSLAIIHPWRRAAFSSVIGRGYDLVVQKNWKISCLYLKEARAHAGGPGLALSSSGTTLKRPAFVWKSWPDLKCRFRNTKYGTSLMISCYPATSFANLSILINSVLLGRSYVNVSRLKELPIQTLRRKPVLVCGTPSFWRREAYQGGLETLSTFKRCKISMGGEIATQEILDQLKGHGFESISHLYGLTELGTIFSVSDGREGFPKEYLDRTLSSGFSMKVVKGELAVQSGRGRSYFLTGDIVAVKAGRVHFKGRKDRANINVGGQKVVAQEVEEIVRGSSKNVYDVQVYSAKNLVLGTVVKCTLVLKDMRKKSGTIGAIRKRFKLLGRIREMPLAFDLKSVYDMDDLPSGKFNG